jgi:hypothetical protein
VPIFRKLQITNIKLQTKEIEKDEYYCIIKQVSRLEFGFWNL